MLSPVYISLSNMSDAGEEAGYAGEVECIGFVEGVELFAVDIEHADYLRIFYERDYYF